MSKKIATLALAVAFTTVSVAVAYSFTCKVAAVEGTKVTVDCKGKEKYTKKLDVGAKVKLRVKRKRRAIEGC